MGTKYLVRVAIFAGIYFALSFTLQAISYGPLQFRVGEAMTLLPLIFPEAVLGLTIGCLISNIFSPFGWYDMVFGTLATLIASVLTYIIGRLLKNKNIILKGVVGAIPPILVNALLLPLIWFLFSGDTLYWINFGMILGTQAATIFVLGLPLLIALNKAKGYDESLK
ncbi:MAG TPA: QueT transporter family protein [Clostridiales bacterium]|nr:QueT transporter family protein [Clostridiales bacterium]